MILNALILRYKWWQKPVIRRDNPSGLSARLYLLTLEPYKQVMLKISAAREGKTGGAPT